VPLSGIARPGHARRVPAVAELLRVLRARSHTMHPWGVCGIAPDGCRFFGATARDARDRARHEIFVGTSRISHHDRVLEPLRRGSTRDGISTIGVAAMISSRLRDVDESRRGVEMSQSNSMFVVLSFLLPIAACAVEESSDEAITSRQGEYVVSSVRDGETIESEIRRAGELVAIATVDREQARVTSLVNDVEMVSAVPEDLEDLESYQTSLADVSTALELQADAARFRTGGCDYIEFSGGLGQPCIMSWCDGTNCYAIDCAPDPESGCGEEHYIAPECAIAVSN
jgi:hypothetical protein